MKKLLILPFIITFGLSYTMEDDSICNEIKRISPEASIADYQTLVQKLRNAKKSTCDCIRYLSQKKIDKAKQALEKEWKIGQKEWNTIEEIREHIFKKDNQKGGYNLQTNFEFVPHADGQTPIDDFSDTVLQKFYDNGRTNNTVNIMYRAPQVEGMSVIVGTSINRSVEAEAYPIDHENQRLKSEIITATEYNLNIGYDFFKHSAEAQQGILAHEILGHVPHDDVIVSPLAFWSACIYKPELINNQSEFFNSDSHKTFTKAKEARADRVPAACTSLENARSIEKWFIESHQRLQRQLKKGKHIEQSDHHPSDAKRLAMATRIRKLKEAEQLIK